MGRGLSDLQKNILCLALSGGIRVRDLLEKLWGWQAKPGKESGQVFDRASIGRAKYGQTHATLSRALERLRLRSMVRIFKDVTRYGTMISLTSYGEEVAKGIVEAEGEPDP